MPRVDTLKDPKPFCKRKIHMSDNMIGAMELREELWIELVPLEPDSAGSVEEASSGEREGRPMEAWKGFQGKTGSETSKV